MCEWKWGRDKGWEMGDWGLGIEDGGWRMKDIYELRVTNYELRIAKGQKLTANSPLTVAAPWRGLGGDGVHERRWRIEDGG